MIEDGELREMVRGAQHFWHAAMDAAASARAAVVVWRYIDAAAPWWLLEPHAAERSGRDRREEHPVPERVRADEVDRLGYDAEGRLVIREPCGHDGWTEVASYSGDTSESFAFLRASDPHARVRVVTVSRQRWSDGLIVSHRRFWPPASGARRIVGWVSEEYTRDAAGRVCAVTVTGFTPSVDRGPVTYEQRVHRGSDGAIERIDEVRDGATITVFTAPSRDRASAPSRYQEALRRRLIAAARGLWPPEPVLGIVVVTSDGGTLPPDLVLVTQRGLEQQLNDDPNDRHGAWMPGEHELWASAEATRELPADEPSWRPVTTELDDDPTRIWELLRATCAGLNEEDWSDLPGGPNAIVCLSDATNSGRAEFFSKQESQLTDYRQRGWIP